MPNHRSSKLENISEKWVKVNDLWNGTDSLKEAGRIYLPQEPHETDDNYRLRLQRSVLFNKYKKTVETSVGKIFTKPLVVSDLPIQMESHLENIDAEDSTFHLFAKRICTDAIHMGIGYIVVDYPINTDNNINAAPYWVRIDPLSVVDIQVDFINGIEVLTRFAFEERTASYNVGSYDLSDTTTTTQTKVFYLDETLSPQYVVLNDEKHVIDSGPIMNGAGQPLSKIPVIPAYGEKVEPYVGTPVLMDLAELNLSHWQDYSDLRNINHISSVPMLFIKGAQEQYDDNGNLKQITISPNSVVSLSDPSGDAKFIEHSGNSITTSLSMLQHLEDKMSVMGLELSVDNTTTAETATGRSIDAAEANSKIVSIALDLETALENALQLHAEYVGIVDAEIKVLINTDFSKVLNTADMSLIMALYNDGIISASDVLTEAKQRTLVSNDLAPPESNNNTNVNDEE